MAITMEFPGILFAALPALIVVAAVEAVLSASWVGAYFRFGLPVFRWRSTARVVAIRLPDARVIQEGLSASRFVGLMVNELDATTYAFRERAWQMGFSFRYSPVMRGLLRLHSDGSVEVVGNVNWSVLVFAVVFVSVSTIMPLPVLRLVIPLGFVVIIGGIYLIQARRFREVGERSTELLRGSV